MCSHCRQLEERERPPVDSFVSKHCAHSTGDCIRREELRQLRIGINRCRSYVHQPLFCRSQALTSSYPDAHVSVERRRLCGALESAIATMYQLPHLTSLSLNFWPTWHSESHSAIRDQRVEFIARQKKLLGALYSSKPHQSLKSLTIVNLCLLHPRADRSHSRRSTKAKSFTQLHDLTITLLSDAEHAQVAEGDDRPVVQGPRDHLPPSHSQLRSLTLRSPRGLFHTHDLCPHGLIYPNLTVISLENIVLGRPSSSGGMISFIFSHKATLRKLELRSCPVIISDCTTDALRYWSQIWDRFAADLSVLTDFTVTHGQFGTGYTMFVEDKELETIILAPLRSQADEAALDSFRRVVTERRVF